MGYDVSPDLFRALHFATLAGYLIGSIPFGLLLTKLFGYGDIRDIGSGNIGATNVLRTGNKPLALATLLLDSGKGAIAVLAVRYQWGDFAALYAAAGAVVGHMFPVWLRFKGGKGVATTLGTLIAVNWIVGLAACAIWLITAAVTRYSSLSALIAMLSAPIVGFALGQTGVGWVSLVLALAVWGAHHENIRRLLSGEEPKIGQKKSQSDTN